MKLMPLKSMEMDDEDKLDTVMPIPLPEKPDHPYGLRICLTGKELEKLGLDADDAEVGSIIHLHALARVTDVSSSDGTMGKSSRVELQITDMCCVESEDEENEEAETVMRRNPLHDNERSI